MENELLRVEDLYLHYRTSKGNVRAVDGVSFDIGRQQALAVIGESGCGKSSLARAILKLLPRNVALYQGKVLLNGADISLLKEEEFRKEVRWTNISFVPQAAMNSLNPVLKVGEQIMEPLLTRNLMQKEAALERTREVLQLVG
ncbi:MAG: ATP-binding cassette domain-containing protein, partial [Chloroflexota bacterium]